MYAAPGVLYRAHGFGKALRVHLYLYRLQSRAQAFQFFVQLVHLAQGLVLAYQPYLEVLLYAARLRLGVAVALPLVGRASLHDVCRLRLGLYGQLALGGLVYLLLYLRYFRTRRNLGFHRRGIVKLLLHVRQSVLHDLQFGAFVLQSLKPFYLFVYRIGSTLRRGFQFLLIGYLAVYFFIGTIGGYALRTLQFESLQFGLADFPCYLRQLGLRGYTLLGVQVVKFGVHIIRRLQFGGYKRSLFRQLDGVVFLFPQFDVRCQFALLFGVLPIQLSLVVAYVLLQLMLSSRVLVKLRFCGCFLAFGKVARFCGHAHAFQYFLSGFELFLVGLQFGDGRFVGGVLHFAHRVLYGLFGLRPVHLAYLQRRGRGFADILHFHRHLFHLAFHDTELALQLLYLGYQSARLVFEVRICFGVLLRYNLIGFAMRPVRYSALARFYGTAAFPKVAPLAVVVFEFYFFLGKF